MQRLVFVGDDVLLEATGALLVHRFPFLTPRREHLRAQQETRMKATQQYKLLFYLFPSVLGEEHNKAGLERAGVGGRGVVVSSLFVPYSFVHAPHIPFDTVGGDYRYCSFIYLTYS